MEPAAIIQTLLEEGQRRGSPAAFLERACALLRGGGLALDRLNFSLRRLHPEMIASTYHWDSDSGQTEAIDRPYSVMEQADFQASPIAALLRNPTVIRRRLLDPDCPRDFEILDELREQGFTDYRISPLRFSGGVAHPLSIATRHPQGFTEAGLALLDACEPALTAVLEVLQLRETARLLLSTYVGQRAGTKVWDGTIRRGQGEVVHAIVYLCDLRGFTRIAAEQPTEATIALLNRYFDAMGGAVVRRGGEILKFIGDALLAIFPCERDHAGNCPHAAAALAAAEEGLAALAEMRLQAAVTLAVGDLLYGNIGGANRLDFTVIGPAVNIAARLQGLAARLGEPILFSAPLARRLPRPARSRGLHSLKGAGELEVFAP